MTELRYAKSEAAEPQVERPRCAQLRIMWNFALDRVVHAATWFNSGEVNMREKLSKAKQS